jgi:succinyl-CoA synthetase alpha subunit
MAKARDMINEVAEGKSVDEVVNEATKLKHSLRAVGPKLVKNADAAVDSLQAANKEIGVIKQNVTVKDINRRCADVIMKINDCMDDLREILGPKAK